LRPGPASLKDEITALEYKLATLPDEAEIEAKRDKWAGLIKRGLSSYLQTGVALYHLPFEAQKKIIRLIFGGKDEKGRRYGIYVKDLGGKPRKLKFEAYGKLGNISGWVESKSGAFESGGELQEGLAEDISKVILDAESTLYKDFMNSI
jgi:hypothetical protein